MIKYAPFVPGITVSGPTVVLIAESVTSFSVLREVLLETLGVTHIDPSQWYPQEDVLRTYQKIDALLGGRGLERVGRLVPTRAIFPPGIDSALQALASLDLTYHMNHRRDGVDMVDPSTGAMLEGIGHYRHRGDPGGREVVMVSDNPYPCRFDMALFQGFVERFEPRVEVVHEPDLCRSLGDATCTYRARW